MNRPNPIIDVLRQAQKGKLIPSVAVAAGVEAKQADVALEVLSRAIAKRIAAHLDDPERYEALLNLLEDDGHDEYLDNPGEILSRDAVEEGEEILKLVYGSIKGAHRLAGSLSAPKDMDHEVFQRLMTLAATLTSPPWLAETSFTRSQPPVCRIASRLSAVSLPN